VKIELGAGTSPRWNVTDKKNSFVNSKFIFIFDFLLGCGNSRILVLIMGASE